MLGPTYFDAEIPRQRFVGRGGDLELEPYRNFLKFLNMGETLVEDDGTIDVVVWAAASASQRHRCFRVPEH